MDHTEKTVGWATRLAPLILLALTSALHADTEVVNGIEWTYTVSDGEASVGSGHYDYGSGAVPTSTSGAITIPLTLGGHPVTSIGDWAFYGCDGLKSVTIPDSVTSIGVCAFNECSGLTSVTIPSSVTSINDSAFIGCGGLMSFTVEADNPNYSSANRLLLSKDGTTLISGVNGDVTIPNSVTSIGDYAFSGCSGLTSVTIPNSVTSIGFCAFNECGGLTSVTIPDSVTSIGGYAFNECSGFTSVKIPSSVTSIEYWAFSGCGGLTSVTIPSSVTSIEYWAFSGCSGLTSVTIPSSVTSIGEGAFSGCSSLTSVTIPDSVTSIGDSAFIGCSGLMSFTVEADNPNYSSANRLLLSKDGTTLISGVNGDVTIPDSVTSIGDYAFSGCSGLTSVTIPSSVTSIGYKAFDNCSGLRKLLLPTRFQVKTFGMGIPSRCDVVFYSGKAPPCKVVFNANGGKLPKGKSMAAQTFTYGKAAKLRKNLFMRKGYVFAGWSLKKNGAVAYKDAQSVKNLRTDGKTTTLYAVWAKPTYKVAFYANGGKGTMTVESFTYGKAKKLSANKFKRKGYAFKGWAKSKALAKKGTVAYRNKQSVKNLVTTGKTVKLYAVWQKK